MQGSRDTIVAVSKDGKLYTGNIQPKNSNVRAISSARAGKISYKLYAYEHVIGKSVPLTEGEIFDKLSNQSSNNSEGSVNNSKNVDNIPQRQLVSKEVNQRVDTKKNGDLYYADDDYEENNVLTDSKQREDEDINQTAVLETAVRLAKKENEHLIQKLDACQKEVAKRQNEMEEMRKEISDLTKALRACELDKIKAEKEKVDVKQNEMLISENRLLVSMNAILTRSVDSLTKVVDSLTYAIKTSHTVSFGQPDLDGDRED